MEHHTTQPMTKQQTLEDLKGYCQDVLKWIETYPDSKAELEEAIDNLMGCAGDFMDFD